MTGSITVEVAYGERDQQALVRVLVPQGATVADAISKASLEQLFPDIEIDPNRIGIFGRRVEISQALKAGDRVEVYRPLIADPKEVRRARARRDG